MEEERNDEQKDFRENIFTKSVRAGKRTYYLDVKETKNGERYVTITERKRRYNNDGSYKVEKHKIFLYQEDFDDFADALDDTIDFIQTGNQFNPEISDPEANKTKEDQERTDEDTGEVEEYTLESFEDLEG